MPARFPNPRTNRLHGGGKRALVAADGTVPFVCVCVRACTVYVHKYTLFVGRIGETDTSQTEIFEGPRVPVVLYYVQSGRVGDGPKCCDAKEPPNVTYSYVHVLLYRCGYAKLGGEGAKILW